tara:strand:- start:1610 stop:2068 length:459 start_codon:yes stop_codon:yes gene_type:complete
MKAKTFENLIRKVVREEIDYSLRREIKSLKEDLRDELKPTITEHTERLVEVPNTPMSETAKSSLREKIMGSNLGPKKPIKKQNFVAGNSTLNDLLNETAAGDTNTETTMASPSDPFGNSGVIPTEAMPQELQGVVKRDYRELMRAIDKKKRR